jgi:hypothetical protein
MTDQQEEALEAQLTKLKDDYGYCSSFHVMNLEQLIRKQHAALCKIADWNSAYGPFPGK